MLGAKDMKRDFNPSLYKRFIVFLTIIFLLFLILAIRLFLLQVVQNDKYSMLSSQNQVRMITQPARRGNIYDKNMVELANSKVVFAIAISSTDLDEEERKSLASNLANILNDPEITAESIEEQIINHSKKYEPIIVTRVPYEENLSLITTIEENRDKLPGVIVIEEPQRNYPLGTTAGHILGQVGLISDSESDLIEEYDYLSTDWIGKSGLEYSMERFVNEDGEEIGLRGKRGVQTVEVNSQHQTVRVISEEAAIPGNSLVLTIDSEVQKAMEESLASTIADIQQERPKCQAGAGVLLDVKTGGVIAMASYPEMDPNDFSKGLSSDKADYYWDEDLKPLFNRAISAAYPPGSTFKPSTAMAVMASGKVSPDFSLTCNSSTWVPPMATCPRAHGHVDLVRAMAVSCNAYFQVTAAQVGIETLYPLYQKLGYGQLTGIELPSEVKGLLASPEWKAENFPEDDWEHEWRLYDTYYMSMGQGFTNNTPIQMASAIAAIANDGERMQVHLVDKILDYQNNEIYQMEPTVVSKIEADQSAYDIVQEAMRAVCQSGGAAYSLFGNYPIEVAAKTGTAQTGLQGDDPDSDYHGWFVAFAPYDDPEVAFAGVIEYGYHGGTSAGRVCKAVFDEYFGLNEGNEEDGENTQVDMGIITGTIE